MDVIPNIVKDVYTILEVSKNTVTAQFDEDTHIISLVVTKYQHLKDHAKAIYDYFVKALYVGNSEIIWYFDMTSSTFLPDSIIGSLHISAKMKILSRTPSYFDIIPRDVILHILSKLDLDGVHFRKLYPTVLNREILTVAKVPQLIISKLNDIKSSKKLKGIFEEIDDFGVIVVLNSEELEMTTLEKFFPYLKLYSLWSMIVMRSGNNRILKSMLNCIHLDEESDVYHDRYVMKIFYNDIYIRLTPTIMTLLKQSFCISERGIKICWYNLINDIISFDKDHGLKNYTVRVISKGLIDDDSIGVASLYKSVSDQYSVFKTIINWIYNPYWQDLLSIIKGPVIGFIH